MANPIIDKISVIGPNGLAVSATNPLNPGDTATVTITAHDLDTQTLNVSAPVTDSVGKVVGQLAGNLFLSDVLDYAVTSPVGIVTLKSGKTNVFLVKV